MYIITNFDSEIDAWKLNLSKKTSKWVLCLFLFASSLWYSLYFLLQIQSFLRGIIKKTDSPINIHVTQMVVIHLDTQICGKMDIFANFFNLAKSLFKGRQNHINRQFLYNNRCSRSSVAECSCLKGCDAVPLGLLIPNVSKHHDTSIYNGKWSLKLSLSTCHLTRTYNKPLEQPGTTQKKTRFHTPEDLNLHWFYYFL